MLRFLMVCCLFSGLSASVSANDAIVLVTILDAEYQARQTAKPDLPVQNQDVGEVEPTPVELDRRVLYLTANWCGYCRKVVPQLEGLKQKNWKVGSTPDMQIQVVDVDSADGKATLAQYGIRYSAIPAFVLIDKGRAHSPLVGYRDAFGIAEIYTGRRMR